MQICSLARESGLGEMNLLEKTLSSPKNGAPRYMAHFVIHTNRFEESVAWYETFFDAECVHSGDGYTFLTFDDEHHRVAIVEMPGLEDHNENSAGVDHIAFTMDNVESLVAAYERNSRNGINPFWCINHGPTTSMYYKDPLGVKIELQVDNSAYVGGPRAFFDSEEFKQNPLGIEFDPDELIRRYKAGEEIGSLLARPDTGDA